MSEQIIAGRYRVLKNKGDNGLCSTHFVEDSVNGERLVVKIFADTDPAALEYIKTANLLRDSDPRGIVPAVDGGLLEDPNGFYLACPLLEGHSLDNYFKVIGSLSIAELNRITGSLLVTLNDVHKRGYLHLFLNPHNILYAPGMEVHVKDLALSAELFTPLLERLTSYDYSFFSPELMDSPGGAGTPADIFALGRVIEIALEHLSRESLTSQEQNEYDRLLEIASRCMELDPQARYQDMEAVLEAVSTETVPPTVDAEEHASRFRAGAAMDPLPETDQDLSFLERDLVFETEETERFGHSDPGLIGSPRRNSARLHRREGGFPWMKLAFLGASVAVAIGILILGHDLPGKSARTSEGTNNSTEESSDPESTDATGLSAPGSGEYAEGDAGSAQQVLFPNGDTPIIDAPGDQNVQPGLDMQSETAEPQQTALPFPEAVEPVAQAPVASFFTSPDSGGSPLQVYLDASGSYDPDGIITSYAWSFGGSGAALYHVFEGNILPCTIPITLTVTDAQGLSASVTHYVTVY